MNNGHIKHEKTDTGALNMKMKIKKILFKTFFIFKYGPYSGS